MRNEDGIEIDLERLFRTLRRRWRQIALTTVLAGISVLLISLLMPRQYTSTVLFYVDGAEADSAMVLVKTGETLVGLSSGISRAKLEEMLSVREINNTGYFEVTVTGADAMEIKRIADAVAQALPQRVAEVIPNATAIVADPAQLATAPSFPSYPKAGLIGALSGFFLSAGHIAVRVIFAAGRKKRRISVKSPPGENPNTYLSLREG